MIACSSTPNRPSRHANILIVLPAELLIRIFSYLPAAPPSDIAACRLVNRTFKEHSSPFLIPRVIFARRLEVVTKLREVLEHPYFRRYVTELVYDGSSYDEETAMDWEQYVEECERAPRDLEDGAWVERQRRDGNSWKDLDSFRMNNFVRPSPGDNDNGRELTSDGDGVPTKCADGAATPPLRSSEAFRRGCGSSYADYMQRYLDQQYLQSERVDANILAAAFATFPKLRSVVYTDHRGLARDGENYNTCCQRQFGRTLEPQHAGIATKGASVGDRLFPLLRVLSDTPSTTVQSFSIGPHAFEYTGEDTSELADPSHPLNAQYLDISTLEDELLGPDTKLSHMLSHLKHLRFAFCYSGHCSDEDRMRSQICKFLEASAPRLQSLILHTMYLFWGGVREVPRVDNDTRFGVFASAISPLRMPYLRTLSLRRWIFTAGELEAFLLEHAATLRKLHLLGCLCGDDETSLARWGGQTLNLTGIELTGFLSVLDFRSANLYGWKCVDAAQWRQMRPTVTEREARDLETMWLAGRKNWVTRQQRREISPGAEWWRQPAYM